MIDLAIYKAQVTFNKILFPIIDPDHKTLILFPHSPKHWISKSFDHRTTDDRPIHTLKLLFAQIQIGSITIHPLQDSYVD